MAPPSISIVTPSYNQADFLEQTITSVLDQQYPHLEYIIIDGGSTDHTVDVIKAYERGIDYWVSEKDRGQSHAINKGFEKSTGDIMGWLNSDDVLLPNALDLVGEIFETYPTINCITSWTVNIDQHGRIAEFNVPAGTLRGPVRWGWHHGRGLGFIQQASTFWRRSLWEKSGGYIDEKRHYSMDYELWQRFARHSDIVTVRTAFSAFRYQTHQKTHMINAYYQEIGVPFPQFARVFTIPLRVLYTMVTWPLTPRIVYKRNLGGWKFVPAPFFNADST